MTEMVDESIQQCLKDVDLGVEEENKMDPSALSQDLGYIDNLPFLFNPSRHKTGYNPWDKPAVFDSASPEFSSENIIPSSLHWHQLAGVHSIFRTVFSPNEVDGGSNCRGMLIADEVGLGKTAMVITVMVTLSHLIWLQGQKKPLPPLFRESKIFY